MIAIVGILFLATVIAVALVLRGTRRWVFDTEATEARLRDPGTHTLTFVVPDGQDPAALMAALAHAHFTTAVDTHGGVERLLVACEDSDRAQVRQILETVRRTGFGGSGMKQRIRFEDEPGTVAS